jgi:hypothetical protein
MYSLNKNEHRIFKPVEAMIERDWGRKKKIIRDEPMWFITHIYLEMSWGNSSYSYLKQTKMAFIFDLQNQTTGG